MQEARECKSEKLLGNKDRQLQNGVQEQIDRDRIMCCAANTDDGGRRTTEETPVNQWKDGICLIKNMPNTS
jgi:hypothetical protein